MSWSTSNRRHELPENWERIRRRVLREANYTCEINYDGCVRHASEVDHIRRGPDHSRGNLRAACKSCHQLKSSSEGLARRRELKALKKRPEERHPGAL